MKKFTIASTMLLLLSESVVLSHQKPASSTIKFGKKFLRIEPCGTTYVEKHLSAKYLGPTYENFQKTFEPLMFTM